ncbi:hypothetical protein [Chromobacterium sphagni]|uniref:DUF3168 domain-containing protein n=1 Tax=Chromobacterium sphagni TaxID=1903179 RepID=A0ABX3CDZ3_9NEIS|nr:hypothetical protein [Chromobacterium sphagni]OHX20509.1 hypothetical protein BI344_08595 [Chromobacterium sphagni]
MSKIQSLILGVEQALLGATPADNRVSRDLERGYSFGEFPALLLHQLQDIPLSGSPVGYEYRQLSVELEIRADGDVPHEACNEVLEAAHGALHASLEVQDLQSGMVEWGYDEENPALGVCRAHYLLTYRRREGEL